MKTEQIGKHTVKFYDSLDELPLKLFVKFNKFSLIDAHVGSDLNDITERIHRISRFIELDKSAAKIELENLQQALYFIASETSPKHLSFAVLVHSIDGEIIFDKSDENIKRVAERLGSYTSEGFLNRFIAALKKKLDSETKTYFADTKKADAEENEHYVNLRKRTLLQLDEIIRGNDNDAAIQAINDMFLMQTLPLRFSGKDSAEARHDKNYAEIFIVLKKELNFDADKATALEFLVAFEQLTKIKK